ncbi:antibiotic biosynthesis monooxygenase [Flavobacterium sp. Sd200]|uniref:putative quinol monooxygenase n=1 Tax=Flavobacterium sp. Sd200 TaxID=2692211 RepID=UPI0013704734|nr:putative quinol monooxygenase [Flavobacterium sp. Sd200]MXN93138.1 antibiotic biosynthesis monooxygenase [Flavobacterium sp. Sd200]
MINLTAIIKSHPGKEEELKQLLLSLVSASRQEAACLQYNLHQAADEQNVFIFHEIWESAEKLKEHNDTPHLKVFLSASETLLSEPIKVYITNQLA